MSFYIFRGVRRWFRLDCRYTLELRHFFTSYHPSTPKDVFFDLQQLARRDIECRSLPPRLDREEPQLHETPSVLPHTVERTAPMRDKGVDPLVHGSLGRLAPRKLVEICCAKFGTLAVSASSGRADLGSGIHRG